MASNNHWRLYNNPLLMALHCVTHMSIICPGNVPPWALSIASPPVTSGRPYSMRANLPRSLRLQKSQ